MTDLIKKKRKRDCEYLEKIEFRANVKTYTRSSLSRQTLDPV